MTKSQVDNRPCQGILGDRFVQCLFSDELLQAGILTLKVLLLKGLGQKEIANIRATSERTVREQARSVYRKLGLAGRISLPAFFLEDLLLPHTDR